MSEQRTSSPLKLLREAEHSKVTMEGLQSLSHDKEFWIIRIPRDVSDLYITRRYAVYSCSDNAKVESHSGQRV